MRDSIPNPFFLSDEIAFIALQDSSGQIIAECMIDLDDFDRVQSAGRWSLSRSANRDHFQISSNHLHTKLGRFILDAPVGKFVHPRNGNVLDCRKSNLVIANGPKGNRHISPRITTLPEPPMREWTFIKEPEFLTDEERIERSRAAQRAASMRRYETRRAWYRSFMAGRTCMDCGASGVVLHWHHRDPASKVYNVSHAVLHRTDEELQREIERCDLLCVPCHWERHRILRAA